ncbi:hypothetical protein HAX54_004292 [Datura stramonium]|uniref:Putative plant transposon protein domain-containing protein n=1 Tax=Datura stramonium TaxID=4076 RepID=A0ABS8T803_DATST|nr:hypothetical protein [Datura stramonium]
MVRGKEVDITPTTINSTYWAERVRPVIGFARHLAIKEDQYVWVTDAIIEGQPLWVVMKGDISRQDLKFEARMWLDLVCTRLIPSMNTIHISIEVAILIACIMARIHINMGEIITKQFKRKARQHTTFMPFLVLISLLCIKACFPCFRPLYKMHRVEGVFDLATKMYKDAPTIKKKNLTLGSTDSPIPKMSGNAQPPPLPS